MTRKNQAGRKARRFGLPHIREHNFSLRNAGRLPMSAVSARSVTRDFERLMRVLAILLPAAFAHEALAQAPATGKQQLSGHILPEFAQAPQVGELSGTVELHLTVGLPLRNQPQLNAMLTSLYDPKSPDYRHFLTPAQFTEQFGPTDQDYQALTAFARANNLTVENTFANR